MARPLSLLLLIGAAAVPAAAAAQEAESEARTSGARNFTTFGGSQEAARSMLSEMRLERRQNDLCQELGCMVIANETDGYRITGFFVGETDRRGSLRWSRNQFGDPLDPRRATFRFKSAKTDCARPVRFTLQRSGTRETLELERTADFCPTPRIHSLIRIRVVIPQVIVE